MNDGPGPTDDGTAPTDPADDGSDPGGNEADGEDDGTTASETTGTFYVVAADDETATVRDVEDGRIHALTANPGVEGGDALEGTLAPEPPLDTAWTVAELHDHWSIALERSPEPPTSRTREIASEQEPGTVTRVERAGTGEIHVLAVPEGRTDAAAEDVLEDEATRERAARLGVDRVEVRVADGVLGVRYLP